MTTDDSESKKPREFWVVSSPQLGELTFEKDEKAAIETFEFEKMCCPDTTEFLHLIEKSHHEAVVKKLEAELTRHKELLRVQCNYSQDLADALQNLLYCQLGGHLNPNETAKKSLDDARKLLWNIERLKGLGK